MRTQAVISAGHRTFHIVGTVRGYVPEAARVEAIFDEVAPRAVGLGVGPEDLVGLRSLLGGTAYEHDYGEADAIYAHYLGLFGEVELPPRDLVTAVRRADAAQLPVMPLDLPEVEYVEVFTAAISGWQLLRYHRLVKKLAKKPPAAESALDLHLAWDARIRRLGGFAKLEAARERRMVEQLRAADWPQGNILILVEAARVGGILDRWSPEVSSSNP